MVEKAEEARARYGAAEVEAYGRKMTRLLLVVIASVIVTMFAPVVVFVLIAVLVGCRRSSKAAA